MKLSIRACLGMIVIAGTLLTVTLASSGTMQSGGVRNLPSKHLTPGWLNPFVHQNNIHSTICISGYTSTIRPSRSYTTALKVLEFRYLRLPGNISDYELDHFIPLELGGNPYDTRNLWMEAWANARKSDPYENKLHKEVCDDTITLKQARLKIIDFKRMNG